MNPLAPHPVPLARRRRPLVGVAAVGRILRLNLLAPDIVEAIVNGRQPVGLRLEQLTRQLPVEWEVQRTALRLIT